MMIEKIAKLRGKLRALRRGARLWLPLWAPPLALGCLMVVSISSAQVDLASAVSHLLSEAAKQPAAAESPAPEAPAADPPSGPVAIAPSPAPEPREPVVALSMPERVDAYNPVRIEIDRENGGPIDEHKWTLEIRRVAVRDSNAMLMYHPPVKLDDSHVFKSNLDNLGFVAEPGVYEVSFHSRGLEAGVGFDRKNVEIVAPHGEPAQAAAEPPRPEAIIERHLSEVKTSNLAKEKLQVREAALATAKRVRSGSIKPETAYENWENEAYTTLSESGAKAWLDGPRSFFASMHTVFGKGFREDPAGVLESLADVLGGKKP